MINNCMSGVRSSTSIIQSSGKRLCHSRLKWTHRVTMIVTVEYAYVTNNSITLTLTLTLLRTLSDGRYPRCMSNFGCRKQNVLKMKKVITRKTQVECFDTTLKHEKADNKRTRTAHVSGSGSIHRHSEQKEQNAFTVFYWFRCSWLFMSFGNTFA